ncbi:MAG TPA: methyltransferase domain-containing protein [Deinococcales bacterium]|nr:methyltransferase domain-containing protein [Deinococcales bacterium]
MPEPLPPSVAQFADDAPTARYHDPLPLLKRVDRLALPEDALVLDVGCGSGLLALDIARAQPAARVVGLDPSPEQVERARANAAAAGTANAEFRVGTADGLLAAGERFHLITLIEVAQFLGDLEAELSTLAALLQPGGALVVKSSILPPEPAGRAFSQALLERFIHNASSYRNEEEWRAALGAASLHVVEIEYHPWRLREVRPERAAILSEELAARSVSFEQAQEWMQNAIITARAPATLPGATEATGAGG